MTTPPSGISEARFQGQVMQLARYYGWTPYHAPDNTPSRNGRRQTVARGWPDLFMVRGAFAIAAELKTEYGRVRPEQTEWLDALALVPGIETYIWRPSNFDALHERLARGRARVEPLYRDTTYRDEAA